MGLLKSAGLIFFSFLLFLVFLFSIFSLVISNSTSYNNLKSNLNSSISLLGINNSAINQTIETYHPLMKLYCKKSQSVNISHYLKEDLLKPIPCSIIKNGTSQDIINYEENSLFDAIYYKDYNCSFWGCFKESGPPVFLFSNLAHEYWTSLFHLGLLFSILILFIMFFLIEKKADILILAGAILFFPALLFLKINVVLGVLIKSFLVLVSVPSLFVLKVFFSSAHSVSVTLLILSAFLIFSGILFSLFKGGMKIYGIISKLTNKFHKDSKEDKRVKRKAKPKKNKNEFTEPSSSL